MIKPRLIRHRETDSGERGVGGAGGGAPPPFFLQSFVCLFVCLFCNHFEELQTLLFKVELIINNAPLTYAYPTTIETCLTPNHLLFADNYYILLTQHQL